MSSRRSVATGKNRDRRGGSVSAALAVHETLEHGRP
jgi:hypothetical protein